MATPTGVPSAAGEAILDWYGLVGRSLPFRATTDPYAILVSEAMAQQTQAARAGEAWARFMHTFPTVDALATATTADVLRAWRGLGYNRRAVNLQRAAAWIVERHGGRVPSEVAALEALPGVGPYTARAVAAIAFGEPVGAVDTNVRRVLGRLVVGADEAVPPSTVQSIADASVPLGRSAAWTHALMDLGATVCRPRRPACHACPAAPWCRTASTGSAGGARTIPVGRGQSRGNANGSFPATSRWLRGRIVDRLRSAPDGAWVAIEAPIGEHDRAAVDRALESLARDGVVQIRAQAADRAVAADGTRMARLPI